MDIYRLDSTTFLPISIVEGYNSMIWTERFIGPGEFEFKTSKVFESLPLLPRGSFISLRDSNEVMVVETTSIAEDADGYPELTIKGRTFETILDTRVIEPTVYNVSWSTYKPYTVAEMAALLLWNHLVNTTGEDPTRENWTIDPYTALPNVVVTIESVSGKLETPQNWWFGGGSAYEAFKDFLAFGLIGIRTIRPNKTSGIIVSFNTTRTASRGNVIQTPSSNITKLRTDIYHGIDRSIDQTIEDQVIFHYDSGHIDRPNYLFSIMDYRNIAYVVSSIQKRLFIPPNIAPDVSGFERKILYVDAGNLDENDPAAEEVLTQKAVTELRKHNMVRLFDGEISNISPYKYGKDYFLGDKVSLLARYGFEETMVVSEYIRTDDAEGDRGYPGLSSLPM